MRAMGRTRTSGVSLRHGLGDPGGAICLSRSAMKLPFRGRGEEPSALWNFLDRPVLLHRVVAGPNLDSGTVLELVGRVDVETTASGILDRIEPVEFAGR